MDFTRKTEASTAETDGTRAPNVADLRAKLAELPLLAGIDWRLLDTIGSEFEWFSLPGGQTLFHECHGWR